MCYDFSDLKNKVVIVVGGYGLIGKEICKGFVKTRSILIIADKIDNRFFLNKLKNLNKSKIIYYKFDISQRVEIKKLIRAIVQKFDRIDVLVNCSFPRTSDWNLKVENVSFRSIKINLINHLGGYFQLTKEIALQMKNQKSGSIINFSSIYGLVGPTFSIYEGTDMTLAPAYPLIKGGINTMTKYFASYFGKYNVRVNCISPGGVFNKQNPIFVKRYESLTPLGRMANPKDIVMPVLFLASDGSRYITGHNLIVDGGWTIH